MRIATVLTLMLILGTITACGGGGGDPLSPPPADRTAEWTVMVYMGADNNLAPCALADIDELEQVGSTDKVHFTVLADVYYVTQGLFGIPIVTAIYDSQGRMVTPMMHISKHPEEGVQSHLSDPEAFLYSNEGFNSADPAMLTNFIKWSKQRFPAKRYALVIWDHGSSWTPGRSASGAVYDDYEADGNGMYIHEIETAIKNSGVHLSLLDFTACNMASVEVMYQLRGVTDYICASQKIMLAGSDACYQVIASYLTSHPAAGAVELGKVMVDAYVDAYARQGRHSVTQSLVRTDRIEAVAGAVSQLTPLLADPKVVSSDKLRTTFYEPIRFFRDADLCNYTNVVPYHVQNAALNAALGLVRQKVHEAVVYNKVFVGDSDQAHWTFGTRKFGDNEDINVNGVGGLSIYLPTERDWTQENFGYYSSIAFAKASGWNWVIAHAYKGVPYLGTAPGGWWSMLVWSTGVDLDLVVFEPDGYGGLVPASPSLGPAGTNGYLSYDSYWTGISAEAYQTFPRVIWGPYFFLALYSGPSFYATDAYCQLAIGASVEDEDPLLSDVHYISATRPLDPDFGPGVVYFGFALYDPDDGYWYFFEEDRTGGAVTQDQIDSISGQLHQLCPGAQDMKLRSPQGIDQGIIEKWNQVGAELAQRLRESLGKPSEPSPDSGWARGQ